MADLHLRAAEPSDSAALAVLASASADSGAVAFSPRYTAPVVEAMSRRHANSHGVVATTDSGEIAGAAWVSLATCRVGDRVAPCAVLHSLAVHPNHRRRGVATALTERRLDLASELGENVVVMAGIQTGNAGSEANSRHWATQVLGAIAVTPVPVRARPPKPMRHVNVREATMTDVPAIVDGLASQYRSQHLGPAYDGEFLRTWMSERFRDRPLNRYLLAESQGEPVAGLGIVDLPAMMTMHVESMPSAIRFANRLVKVVPPDGEMRNLVAVMPWYRDDGGASSAALRAARYLCQWARADCARQGTALIAAIDRTSPIRQMLRTPPWLPSTAISVAVRAPRPLDTASVVDPYLVV